MFPPFDSVVSLAGWAAVNYTASGPHASEIPTAAGPDKIG